MLFMYFFSLSHTTKISTRHHPLGKGFIVSMKHPASGIKPSQQLLPYEASLNLQPSFQVINVPWLLVLVAT